MNYTLEEEIENAAKRVEERQNSIDSELKGLTSKINKYTYYAWGLVWLGVIIVLASIYFYWEKITATKFELNLLGDFMGGTVASVWSLAGLLFIYVAFLGQKQQLLNQQLEILYSQLEVKYTRLELSGQKEEMKEQNMTLRSQQFENTFFQLLNLLNSIVDSFKIRNFASNVITDSGRDCLVTFYSYFFREIQSESFSNKLELKDVIKKYEAVYKSNKSDLSHYFRTLYHIVKFVDQSDIENKKQYISIIRAQLSNIEQALLFYNCLHENGREKFKPLIEKYALFKNIDRSLILSEEHFDEYDESAYGK